MVTVSFNNRLGALGFLAHPVLSAARAERVSGNYGNLDQIAMLGWVQRNIAAFGGDPRRVMLFGTSAGGGSICALMTAPAARGLFQRAAMQSRLCPPAASCRRWPTCGATGTANASPRRWAGRCPMQRPACARKSSAEEMVRAFPGTFGVLRTYTAPMSTASSFPSSR